MQQLIIVAFLSSKRQKSAFVSLQLIDIILKQSHCAQQMITNDLMWPVRPPSSAFVDSWVKCWLYPHPPSSCMAHLTPQLPVGETRASGQGDVCYQPASSVTHAPACWTESVWARLCIGVSALRLLVSLLCVFVRECVCVYIQIFGDTGVFLCGWRWLSGTWRKTQLLGVRCGPGSSQAA